MSDRPIIKIAPADLPSDMNIEERLVFLGDQVASLTAAPTIVSLSKIPSPKITSGLTSSGTGVQFTFSQLSLSGIDGYRVYKNSTNSFAGATQLEYLKHSALLTTSVTVADTLPAGTAAYYWVTAVSTSQLESAPSAAQAASVASGSIVGSDGNLKLKNIARAVGLTSSPTTSSTSFSTLANMSVSANNNGNNVLVTFSGTFFHSQAGGEIHFAVFRNGSQQSPEYVQGFPTLGASYSFTLCFLDLNAIVTAYTYTLQWRVLTGTGTAVTTQRELTMIELG